MRNKLLVSSCAALFLMAGLLVSGAWAEKAEHPELNAQEMLIPCSECHRKETPEIEKQWYGSLHGVAMVKCYMCHGTFENFRVTPEVSNCAVCHEAMVEKCPKDKKCWECHQPHDFKAAK